MADSDNKEKKVDEVVATEVKSDAAAKPTPGQEQPASADQGQPSTGSKPLTTEEVKKNAEEEDRKTMRVIQIIQHVENQRVEIIPVQNITFRSDIIGILEQGLHNINNEDILRNDAVLIKEAVAVIKKDIAENK